MKESNYQIGTLPVAGASHVATQTKKKRGSSSDESSSGCLLSHVDRAGAGKRVAAGITLKRQQQELTEVERRPVVTEANFHPDLSERRLRHDTCRRAGPTRTAKSRSSSWSRPRASSDGCGAYPG